MKFIFDLDDTLVSGDIISHTCAKLLSKGLIDKLYTNKDIHYYDLRDLPVLLRTRVTETFADPEHVWLKAPIAGAYYFLHTLESHGHDTGIITSRQMATRSETLLFLSARFPGIKFDSGIEFVNKENIPTDMCKMPSKLERLQEMKPDYYFDDNPDYCVQSKKAGIKTYLISNKYTPWNHVFAEDQRTLLDPVRILRNVAFFPETSIL